MFQGRRTGLMIGPPVRLSLRGTCASAHHTQAARLLFPLVIVLTSLLFSLLFFITHDVGYFVNLRLDGFILCFQLFNPFKQFLRFDTAMVVTPLRYGCDTS